MIAIDTNVLLRYLLQDDHKQSPLATALILNNDSVLVTDVVLAETLWTLIGKRYRLSTDQLIDVLHALFAEPSIMFEDPQAVWGALKDFMNASSVKVGANRKQASFADTLIINKAKRIGDSHTIVYTFDQAALAVEGTKAP